jgi:hypothetical protein
LLSAVILLLALVTIFDLVLPRVRFNQSAFALSVSRQLQIATIKPRKNMVVPTSAAFPSAADPNSIAQ